MAYGLNAVLKQISHCQIFYSEAVFNQPTVQPPACDGAPSTR